MFSAMGCGPYLPEDEWALAHWVKLENEIGGSEFLVHCGDIVTGKNPIWPESQYEKVAFILSNNNRVPTLVVPGDNEWNDQLIPAQGWQKWSRHFMGFEKKFTLPFEVAHQEARPENWAFVHRKGLFIGLNKVGGRVHDRQEWLTRHRQNAEWLSLYLERYRDSVDAAVLFAQAAPTNVDAELQEAFLTPLVEAARAFGKPILYLHADGHRWFVKKGEWLSSLWHVQLDKVNVEFPPVQVTLTGNPEEPFQFDRRTEDPRWDYTPPAEAKP